MMISLKILDQPTDLGYQSAIASPKVDRIRKTIAQKIASQITQCRKVVLERYQIASTLTISLPVEDDVIQCSSSSSSSWSCANTEWSMCRIAAMLPNALSVDSTSAVSITNTSHEIRPAHLISIINSMISM